MYVLQVTPAESRELNQKCIILGFYDNHDVWHFLSATAMFFSFLVSIICVAITRLYCQASFIMTYIVIFSICSLWMMES